MIRDKRQGNERNKNRAFVTRNNNFRSNSNQSNHQNNYRYNNGPNNSYENRSNHYNSNNGYNDCQRDYRNNNHRGNNQKFHRRKASFTRVKFICRKFTGSSKQVFPRHSDLIQLFRCLQWWVTNNSIICFQVLEFLLLKLCINICFIWWMYRYFNTRNYEWINELVRMWKT